MCYDISFTTRIETVLDYLPGLKVDPQIGMDFGEVLHVQAQSFSRFPVIIQAEGDFKLMPFEWGIIPEYMNTPEKIKKGRNSMCNARSEKIVVDKRSYWHRIRKERCLVPVTGIYEHREIKNWKNKVPYLVSVKERALFCLPALYHYGGPADPETGELTAAFSIITRPANSLMKMIHNGGENAFRMPLFLPKEMELQWLNPNLTDEEMEQLLSFEMPSESLSSHPVYTIRSRKDRPDLKKKTDPYVWPGLPPLGETGGMASFF